MYLKVYYGLNFKAQNCIFTKTTNKFYDYDLYNKNHRNKPTGFKYY